MKTSTFILLIALITASCAWGQATLIYTEDPAHPGMKVEYRQSTLQYPDGSFTIKTQATGRKGAQINGRFIPCNGGAIKDTGNGVEFEVGASIRHGEWGNTEFK